MTSNGVHLHLDDYPATLDHSATLDRLAAIAGDRGDLSFDQLCYEVTEYGARVDWDTLTTAPLPANERALAHIAQGCMTIEARGGCSDALGDVAVDVVVDVMTRVVSGERPVGSPFANVTNAHDMRCNDLVGRLNGCSVHGGPALLHRTSGDTATTGELLVAVGGELPGWERDACLASCDKLIGHGFVVRDVLRAGELTDTASSSGSPVVGGVNVVVDVVVDDVVVTIVIRIDATGAIYPRISETSWPPDLL